MSLLNLLKTRFETALSSLVDTPAPFLDMIRVAQDPRFGDFQANFAMPLSKHLGRSPREIATQVLSQVDLADVCDPPEVAGPGFINLRFRDDFLVSRINAIVGDQRLGVAPAAQPRHVVVDFSSPNVAKPMHVGHLRSSVIGDAICRTLRFAGHRVTSDNHIGDWGTQFGMIIFGYRHFLDKASYDADPVNELARLYKLVNQLSDYHAAVAKRPQLKEAVDLAQDQLQQITAAGKGDAGAGSAAGGTDNGAGSNKDPEYKKRQKQISQLQKQVESAVEALEAAESKIAAVHASADLKRMADDFPDIARNAREETVRLHAGRGDNQQLWDQFLPHCLNALQQLYQRLKISFDLTLGESFYQPMLSEVVRDLKARGLAIDSEGATCVFVEEYTAPFIVQKSDGAFTYATTDLATIQYRQQTLKADEVLYVVDKRQSEHFQMLFETARRSGICNLQFRHISFGTVLGTDGRPYKTRSGDTVGLESLIDEAIARARIIVNENDDRREVQLLSEDERSRVAEIVGVGGIKYADLHHNRDSDYTFDWDKMLATTGDTAAYMQYVYARICGIFRKLQISRDSLRTSGQIRITCEEERGLVLQMLQLDQAIDGVLAEYRPHFMTAWLFELADKFNKFYTQCSVQDAETEELMFSRLQLCDLMARSIQTGLGMLGIETIDVM